MRELIELRFQYSEDEFAKAWQFYAMRSLLTKADVIVAIVMMAASLIMTSISGYEWGWALLFAIGFTLLILNLSAYFVTPRREFRTNPNYQEEYYVAFSEDGIHFKTTLAESQLNWGIYNKFWNVPDYYLLFYGPDLFTIIPKRVFAGKVQEDQFKELAERKLSSVIIQIFS